MKLKRLRKSMLMQLSAVTLLSCLSTSAFAEISAFSRANCGGFINESITWEASGVFSGQILSVQSYHVPISSGGSVSPHSLRDSGSSWRARAGDQGDTVNLNTQTCPSISSWNVHGYHSYYDPERGAWIDLGSSFASDCNLSEW